MKKLKRNSIDIRPMSETPDVNFRYIDNNGIMCNMVYHSSEFDQIMPNCLGWIPVKFEVLNDLTFDQLEIGEHFAADDLEGYRDDYVKTYHGACPLQISKERVIREPNAWLTNIKRIKEVE